ncbi:MAG: alpha/beta fold hydrolase [Acidobacteria bacterium]|nr:alpha/beta fold hydrolase [Acidobacteriota bacterium]
MLRLIAAVLYLLTLSVTYGQQCKAPYDVSFRVVDLREGRKAAFWYPTATPGKPTAYAEGGIQGNFTRNEPPMACSFPLIVFSHGLGGCGTQSLFLTEELARAGFVVIAPDHRDAACTVDGSGAPNFQDTQESLLEPEKWTAATYADRKEDVEKAIDLALSDGSIGKVVDRERIGIVGHSLGGYTALGLLGAWPQWRDDRIRAAVLLSPYLLPFQSKKTLTNINKPVMLQGADFDLGITPSLEGANGAYATLAEPRYFVKLKGGSHFEWTNLLCLGKDSIAQCLETKANARLINSYSIDFLRRYLEQSPSALLLGTNSELRTYERTVVLVAVSAASFDQQVGVAPSSIASAFAEGLASADTAAQTLPLPTSLDGVKAVVSDADGKSYDAALFFAGQGQVNLLAPQALARGAASVRITRNGQTIAEGSVQVNSVAPGVFSAGASGDGVAAATYLRVAADGGRTSGLIFDPASGAPTPLDVTAPGEQIYVSLFGTGLRGASAVTATVGGVNVKVAGPVPHSEFAGLDQLNLGPLPASLAGKGLVDIRLSAGSFSANPTQALIR